MVYRERREEEMTRGRARDAFIFFARLLLETVLYLEVGYVFGGGMARPYSYP